LLGDGVKLILDGLEPLMLVIFEVSCPSKTKLCHLPENVEQLDAIHVVPCTWHVSIEGFYGLSCEFWPSYVEN
jgi:hypothetical protein